MKKIFLIVFSSILFTNVFAQQTKVLNLPTLDQKIIHFGFTIGANYMDFNIRNSGMFMNWDSIPDIAGIENHVSPGFHLGPSVNMRLGEYFDFRFLVNLSFGQRNLEFTERAGDGSYTKTTMKLASTYLEFPLMIKYKAARINNLRPYVIAGVNPKYDLAARKKIKDEEMPKIKLAEKDLFYELGVGLDFYLPYFKFSTELKYGAGVKNIIVPDKTNYTRSIDKLTSKMWMISFHFEG